MKNGTFSGTVPGRNYANQMGKFSKSKLGQYYTQFSYFD